MEVLCEQCDEVEIQEFVGLIDHNDIATLVYHKTDCVKETPVVFVFAAGMSMRNKFASNEFEEVYEWYSGRVSVVNTDIHAPAGGGVGDIRLVEMEHPVIWRDPYGMVFAVVEEDGSMVCLPDFPHTRDTRSEYSLLYAQFINDMFSDSSKARVAGLTQKLLDAIDDSVVVKRMEVAFDADLYIENAEKVLKAAEKRIERTWSRKVDRLNEQLADAQKRAVAEVNEVLKVVAICGLHMNAEGNFVHEENIVCSRAKRGSRVYAMDKEMWIEGLVVVVDLNWEMRSAYCKASCHPNCDTDGDTVCIGDFSGKHIREVCELIAALKLPNLDSCYGNWYDHMEEEVCDMWSAA